MHGMKIIFESEPILTNKGFSLEGILDKKELGFKRIKRMRMSKTKSGGDHIKETDIWANGLCDKYCMINKDGKESNNLFKQCMIKPDLKKLPKEDIKKLAFKIDDIEKYCPQNCEGLMPNTAANENCKAQPNDNLRCNNHCHSFRKLEVGTKDQKFFMN